MVKFVLIGFIISLLVDLSSCQGLQNNEDLRRRYPNLHKRGLLPGLLGNRGPQVGVGRQMLPAPGPPGKGKPPNGVPPEQRHRNLIPQPNPGQVIEMPMVKYHEVPWKNSVEHNFKWQENQRSFFTCPRGYFISEISYRFDTAQSTVSRPWASKQGGKTYTLADKIAKKLSPEPKHIRLIRESGKKRVDPRQQFLDAVGPDVVNQSPLTETGCDPILFCLGHQACLFKITVDLCGCDPVPGKRKMFFISVKCTSDSDEGLYGNTKGALELMRREREHVMYLFQESEHSDKAITQVLLHQIPEEEVFGISCPQPSMALQNGYAGYCTQRPPLQEKIVETLWKVLGRVPFRECRQELVEAYCAYHYNTSGGCVPPAFVESSVGGKPPKPGEIHFSFKAMPRPGPRTDNTEHEKMLSDPYINLIPARLGFLILAHSSPQTLDQLLRAIYRPYFFYVIHVDYRADSVRDEISGMVASMGEKGKNIRVLPKDRSFVASWGSFDIVRAELEGFEELCRMGAWDFVINLSGSDLPLRDVDDTAAMLASARGHNFMRQNGNWKDRSDKPTDFSVWYGCGGHVYNVSYRGKRPSWTDMHSTSQWAIFSRDFIELVVSPDRGIFMNNLHFFASTCIIPDESYLASMLKISPLSKLVLRILLSLRDPSQPKVVPSQLLLNFILMELYSQQMWIDGFLRLVESHKLQRIYLKEYYNTVGAVERQL
ncbi:uncharacterized protein [Diadema antillarum]|uniref:uncharacterized protein n=1 Tax=Diadema antillarum TaxID=105358 RepID=UPI003A89AF8E